MKLITKDCAMRKSLVTPFQGLLFYWSSIPRAALWAFQPIALPWAFMFMAFQAKIQKFPFHVFALGFYVYGLSGQNTEIPVPRLCPGLSFLWPFTPKCRNFRSNALSCVIMFCPFRHFILLVTYKAALWAFNFSRRYAESHTT